MINDNLFETIGSEINEFIHAPNALRSLLILILSVLFAYYLSKILARGIIRMAQFIAVRSDNTTDHEKKIQLRRVETYLSVAIALIRAVIVGMVAFFVWPIISPTASSSAATIGASAFFIVIAGATAGMILRDITAGATMIIERWFDIGDFVRVEPFLDVNGVVERVTLRSTKLRNINGEVIWLHNQHIQGVKVTSNGIRTLAVDIFVNNQRVGETLIKKVIATMPVGTIKLAETPEIVTTEQWGDKLWLFTVVGKTAPGREWLMEDYFITSLRELDERRKGPKTLVRPPIARYADPRAEKSFKRAIRMSRSNK